MNVTLRAAATDSDPVTVMTPHGGELMGIWRGVNAPEGACVHVEVDVADAVAWHTIERTAPGTPVLATHADGVTTVRGRLVDLSTDGVLILDLSPRNHPDRHDWAPTTTAPGSVPGTGGDRDRSAPHGVLISDGPRRLETHHESPIRRTMC